MTRYKNLGGNSGVASYEIGEGSIKVEFTSGAIYLYDNAHTGSENISEMQRLAIAGQGLNSYIATNVRTSYARKLK